MKAFNMIFVAAYAFCICLQTGVLVNAEGTNTEPVLEQTSTTDPVSTETLTHDQVSSTATKTEQAAPASVPTPAANELLTKTDRENCKSKFSDAPFVCDSELSFFSFLNFPARAFQTDAGTNQKCKVPPNVKIYKNSMETFEKNGITIKNYYWVGNDKCLPQHVLDQANGQDIEVIYKKEYFKHLLSEQHLSAEAVNFEEEKPAFARIINFKLNWKNAAKTIPNKAAFTLQSGETVDKTFIALKLDATFRKSDITASKVLFSGKENLYAVFIQSSKVNFDPVNDLPTSDDWVSADINQYATIPMGSATYKLSFSLPQCPFDELKTSVTKIADITDVARLDFSLSGLVKEDPNLQSKLLETDIDSTFDKPFHFYIMRGIDEIPIFHAKINAFTEKDV